MEYNKYLVGNRIYEMRKAKQLTQEEMAEKIGISVSHYSHIEQGAAKLSMKLLFVLMKIFNTDANTLLGLEEVA